MFPFQSAFHGTKRTIPTFHGVFSPFFGWMVVHQSHDISRYSTIDYLLSITSCGSVKIQIKSLHIACSLV